VMDDDDKYSVTIFNTVWCDEFFVQI